MSQPSRQGSLFGQAPDPPAEPAAPATGPQLRDKALARVGGRNREFLAKGLALIELLEVGVEVTGESIRSVCEEACIVPDHYAAWGTLVMQAVRRGLLRKTGRYVPSEAPQKHGHATPVYQVCS